MGSSHAKERLGEGAYKVDADGRNIGLGVGIVGKSKQQARLAYTGISDEEKLEEVVVSSEEVNIQTSIESVIPQPASNLFRSMGSGKTAKI